MFIVCLVCFMYFWYDFYKFKVSINHLFKYQQCYKYDIYRNIIFFL